MAFLRRFIAGARSGAWLTRGRVRMYLTVFGIGNIVALFLAVCRTHGWVLVEEKHLTTEFMSFYAAGRLVNEGMPAAVYTPGVPVQTYAHSLDMVPAHVAMQRMLTDDPLIKYFAFYYPPVFWLICAPLARLPYYAALLLWGVLGGGFFLMTLRRIMGPEQSLWPVAAFLAVIENAGQGENAFFSTGLLGFGLLQLEKRPVLAGALFGALCYKPHFLLPVGILLLGMWQWRAIIGGVLSASILCGLSGILFGWQPWLDYFQIVVPHAEWSFRHLGVSYAIQVTPFSAMRMLGSPLWLADFVEISGMAFAAWVLWLASRRASANIRAAVLAASFPLMVSVMLDYDLTICALAVVFFYREAVRTGYLPWERTALAALFGLPIIVMVFRSTLSVPLDPLIVVAFLAVMLVRIRLAPAAREQLPAAAPA